MVHTIRYGLPTCTLNISKPKPNSSRLDYEQDKSDRKQIPNYLKLVHSLS